MHINKIGDEEVNEFDQGEIIWFVPQNCRLVIRCTIEEVDDEFRKKHPDSYLFYWVDEPVGHALSEDEICLTKEEAEEVAGNGIYSEDLLFWRRKQLKFIISTWKDAPEEEKDVEKVLLNYPEKQEGIDWFLVPLVPFGAV